MVSMGSTVTRGGSVVALMFLVIMSCANEQCQAIDIIVIGAGFAGLGAARELEVGTRSNSSPPSVLVLEASNRPGGRVHSLSKTKRRPFPIELGATWIHGGKEPPDGPYLGM
jgi:monoamine oxidase